MPGLAGTSRMPYLRFLTFNAAGAIIWGVDVTLLGFFAGHSYAAVEKALGRTSAVLLVLILSWRSSSGVASTSDGDEALLRRSLAAPPRDSRPSRHHRPTTQRRPWIGLA